MTGRCVGRDGEETHLKDLVIERAWVAPLFFYACWQFFLIPLLSIFSNTYTLLQTQKPSFVPKNNDEEPVKYWIDVPVSLWL